MPKDEFLNIRMDSNLKDKIRIEAEKEKRTMGAQALWYMEKGLSLFEDNKTDQAAELRKRMEVIK